MHREMTFPGMGKTLKQLREQNSWSLTEFADRLGWHKSRLSKYENNELAISLPALEEIAKQLDMRPDVLVLQCLRQKYPDLNRPEVGQLLDRLVRQLDKG